MQAKHDRYKASGLLTDTRIHPEVVMKILSEGGDPNDIDGNHSTILFSHTLLEKQIPDFINRYKINPKHINDLVNFLKMFINAI